MTIQRRRFLKYSGSWVVAMSRVWRPSDARAEQSQPVDYAEARCVDLWLRHPVFGDPSFDAFERVPGNPICTGAPPYGWPVNGFLFSDPVSGNWYIYVGDYATGYSGPPMARCILYRSRDGSKSWENLGPVIQGDPALFDKNGHAPDVSVVFAEGRYHMVYDWYEPDFVTDGGLAYAWAEKPEGPWHRGAQPITRWSTETLHIYGGTLVRRKHDWLIVGLHAAFPHSWSLFAMAAPNPEGPYSERQLVRTVEDSYYHPPLLEGYPAFCDGDWVYASTTSVARNRNFQVIFRAPLEQATEPKAWEIYRHGSVWHSEDVPNEAYGIWGQTISGWIDADRRLWAMFPSINNEGFGTINLATRPWSQPLRARGFHLSGHEAPSLTCLRRSYADFSLDCELRVRGTARIVWNYRAPLGPNQPRADAELHPLSLTRHDALELGPNGWRILQVDAQGLAKPVATGAAPGDAAWNITITRRKDGAMALTLDGKQVWNGTTGTTGATGGTLGLLAERHSHVSVERFAISGHEQTNTLSFLHTEGWLGAGENPANWAEQKDAGFRFGVGAVHRGDGGRAKWNFLGRGLALWSPRGPDFGTAEVWLDGARIGTVNLHRAESQPSQPVFTKTGLADTFHAVTLKAKSGRLILDSLDVFS